MSQKGTRTLGLQVSSTFPVQFQPPLLLQGPSPQREIILRGTKEIQPASNPYPLH